MEPRPFLIPHKQGEELPSCQASPITLAKEHWWPADSSRSPRDCCGANCPQGACRRDGEGPKEQQSLSLASYQQGACCICLHLQISSCAVLCEAAVKGLLPIRLDLGRKRARPDKMPVFATAPSPPSSCVCFIPCPLVGSWTERLVSLRGRGR